MSENDPVDVASSFIVRIEFPAIGYSGEELLLLTRILVCIRLGSFDFFKVSPIHSATSLLHHDRGVDVDDDSQLILLVIFDTHYFHPTYIFLSLCPLSLGNVAAGLLTLPRPFADLNKELSLRHTFWETGARPRNLQVPVNSLTDSFLLFFS